MSKIPFDKVPYNLIHEEERNVSHIMDKALGLHKNKSFESFIWRIDDERFKSNKPRAYKTLLRKPIYISIGYGIFALLLAAVTIWMVLTDKSAAGNGKFIIGGVFLLISYVFFFSFGIDRGTKIELLEQTLLVNNEDEFAREDISDILIIRRPKNSRGYPLSMVIINTDNTYFRYDITDFNTMDLAYCLKKWMGREQLF